MGLSKLRPVGSRVPLPKPGSVVLAGPWADHYELQFINSGTAALSLAVQLAAAHRKAPGKPEVILPAYGCPDLIAAVVAQGACPVLVDLTEDRPWMDLEAVKQALSDNTVAIIAVGFLGISERLTALRRIADEAGAVLVEDSAQLFPPFSSDNGLADYIVLSFGRGKPINLMGGGALLIRKDHAAKSASVISELPETEVSGNSVWLLRRWVFNLLLSKPLYGLMERMPFLGIGRTEYHPLEVLNRQRPVKGLLEAGIESFNNRKDNGAVYTRTLSELSVKGWILLPQVCTEGWSPGSVASSRSILLRYSLLAPSSQIRDMALIELNRRGIGASVFYGRALPALDGVNETVAIADPDVGFSYASDFSERLITLPTHEDVSSLDIETVTSVLLSMS
ncbi:MAG: DegT/DnrJ/EryC1/StrS family aminotransferase [Marinobacter sp.]|uniref:DegT/DnrJ/EryC1/StrS family aminotransferase n=1 Tax=Marinobacter sp. TaxID=50741 RepID=UPI0034A06DE5